MAKDEVKDGKKPSKALPGLIFLLGLALIVGGVLMQIGYFGGNDNPVPTEENEVVDEGETIDEGTVEDEGTVDEGTADAGEADFSITTIEDNVPINVRQGDEYTYAGAFGMVVSDFTVNDTSSIRVLPEQPNTSVIVAAPPVDIVYDFDEPEILAP